MSEVTEIQEQQPKTYTEAEVAELVAGLKRNNEQLLAEKKEASRAKQEAEQARIQAEQQQAKKSGELEQFEQSLRKQYEPVIAEKDARLAAREARILSSERKAVIAGFSGILIDESASDILAMMVKTEFNGDEVVTKFVNADGSVITTDPAQFKKYLCEHKAFSHLIKADASSGGGAGGNKVPGGAGKTMKRSEFDNLNPSAKRQFMAAGGTLTE